MTQSNRLRTLLSLRPIRQTGGGGEGGSILLRTDLSDRTTAFAKVRSLIFYSPTVSKIVPKPDHLGSPLKQNYWPQILLAEFMPLCLNDAPSLVESCIKFMLSQANLCCSGILEQNGSSCRISQLGDTYTKKGKLFSSLCSCYITLLFSSYGPTHLKILRHEVGWIRRALRGDNTNNCFIINRTSLIRPVARFGS